MGETNFECHDGADELDEVRNWVNHMSCGTALLDHAMDFKREGQVARIGHERFGDEFSVWEC